MSEHFCDNPLCQRNKVKCQPDALVYKECNGNRAFLVGRHLYASNPNPGEIRAHLPFEKNTRFHLCDSCHGAVQMFIGSEISR